MTGTEGFTGISGVSNVFPSGSKTFKQFIVQQVLELPAHMPSIRNLAGISITVEISGTDVAATPRGISYGGQMLTGGRLNVTGRLMQTLEYAADEDSCRMQAIRFEIPFHTCIVIDWPDFYDVGSGFNGSGLNGSGIGGTGMDGCDYRVQGYITDAYVKTADKRRVYSSTVLLVNAIPGGSE